MSDTIGSLNDAARSVFTWRRLLIWAFLQSVLVFAISLTQRLSMSYDTLVLPLSDRAFDIYGYGSLVFIDSAKITAITLVTTALLCLCCCWKTRQDRKGISGFLAIFGIAGLTAFPAPPVSRILIDWALERQLFNIQFRTIDQKLIWIYNHNFAGIALGACLLAPIFVFFTIHRTKTTTIRNSILVALVTLIAYAVFGTAHQVFSAFKQSAFYEARDSISLVGITLVLMTVIIGLLLSSSAVHKKRAAELMGICKSCNYDITGIKEICPECGTPLTQQTS